MRMHRGKCWLWCLALCLLSVVRASAALGLRKNFVVWLDEAEPARWMRFFEAFPSARILDDISTYLVALNETELESIRQPKYQIETGVLFVSEYQGSRPAGFRTRSSKKKVESSLRNLCKATSKVSSPLSVDEPTSAYTKLVLAFTKIYSADQDGGAAVVGDLRGLLLAKIPDLSDTELITDPHDGDRILRVQVSSRAMCEFLRIVEDEPRVANVEEFIESKPLNSFSASVGQSGIRGPLTTTTATIWKQGVMGERVVVGVGDSGVDIDSCYFRETTSSSPSLQGCDMRRRKIACYFTGKDSAYGDDAADEYGGHGTHVAATVAGYFAGDIEKKTDYSPSFEEVMKFAGLPNGMAPLARLSINDISGSQRGILDTPLDLATAPYLVEPYNEGGVRIHTNSWGCSKEGPATRTCNRYDAQTRSFDEFMWRNKNFLAIIAAGNSGAEDAIDGNQYNRGFYTIGAPGTSKNGIAVGATTRDGLDPSCKIFGRVCSSNDLMSTSSRGPTFDGRIKPDLVFPGESILSASSSGKPDDFSEGETCDSQNTSTRVDSGTSMSCPGVAGLAALVQEYYLDFDPETGIRTSSQNLKGPLKDGNGPSAALVKATLINCARSLEGTYLYPPGQGESGFEKVLDAENPKHVEGWGFPSLAHTLNFEFEDPPPQDPRWPRKSLLVFDRYALSSGDEPHEFSIDVAAGGFVKATLVYTDPPGPVRAAFDTDPVLMNDLDLKAKCPSSGCSTTLDESTWSSVSRADNVEQIPVGTNNPAQFEAAERIILEVSAHEVTTGPQPYALVVSGRGLTLIDEESTQPNWVPDWRSAAIVPGTFLLHNGFVRAGLGLASLFAVSVLLSFIWPVVQWLRKGPAENDSETIEIA